MKKILIVGATSSIAQHCAKIWTTRGDKIYLVARNRNKLNKIANDLKISKTTHTCCLDINDLSEHRMMLEEADSVLDGIDILLIAHGTLSNQKSCEQSVKETLAEVKTNALSTISILTLIANLFERKKAGTIAIISSVAGDRGRASNYVYGSAKAMIAVFASGLRQRLYKANVAVVTIKPGLIDTPMTAEFKKGLLWTKHEVAAEKIVKAIDTKKNEVYIPQFWWLVMKIIKLVPENIYKKIRKI
jgi:short-subunit dehydrogenase